MSQFTEEQSGHLNDLLKEKSLWQVYRASRRIRFSKTNVVFGVIAMIVVFCFSIRATTTPKALADQLLTFATMAFSLCISQLGFLLAGFSFFATVADREMYCRMAEKTHSKSGLSYLKYNFFVFMRVFVEYLIFAVACLAAMVSLAKGVGIREAVSEFLSDPPLLKHYIAAAVFGLFVGCVVYLLMQLASFIFNVFHVVMTSIRWALQKDYEEQEPPACPISDGDQKSELPPGGN
jgi:hypothetical protein